MSHNPDKITTSSYFVDSENVIRVPAIIASPASLGKKTGHPPTCFFAIATLGSMA